MYDLPFWFLVTTLFTPRVSLFVQWYGGMSMPFFQPFTGITWLFVPRLLVLVMIFMEQGFSGWFFTHLIVAILVYLFGGHAATSN